MTTINSISSNIPIQTSFGGTNTITTPTTDGVIYFDGTKYASTAVGSATQVLTSNGAGVAPTFQVIPSAGGVTSLSGTANQITASASTGAVTLSITTNPTLPGTTTTSGLTSAGTVNINTTGSGITTIGTGGTGAVAIGNATGNTALTGTFTTSGNLTVTAGGLTVTSGSLTLTPLSTAGVVVNNSSGVISSVAVIPIADGGTNATSMANTDGVVYYDGTRLVTTAVGTATNVLTSNGTGVAPTFQAIPAAGVTSITGTANQITASASTGAITLSITTNPTLPGTTTTSGLTSAGTVNINTTGSGITTIGTGGTGSVAIGNTTGNTAVTGTLTTSGKTTITAGGFTVTAGTITLTPLTTAGIVTTTSSGVISSVASVPIANGGTNATSMANTDGVVYYDGTRLVTTTVGASTNVLTSNGTGVAPTFQAIPASVTSIAGTSLQIAVSASTGAVTVSIPTNPTLPGTTTTSGLTSAGTVNINTTGSGVTTIGTGGTGAVAIGNATGNTAVTGALSTTDTITTTGGNNVIVGTSTTAANSLIIERYHGVNTAITSGDTIANMFFQGYDGTQLTTAAKIISVSSGTIASTRVAGDLEFYTHPDSTTSVTQRMVIAPTGAVTINAPDSGVGLTIAGGGLTSTGTTTLSSFSYGALVANTSGVITSAAPGTSGWVLTSNGASALPTFQAPGGGGGGITTLDGDTGSATGATVTIAGGSNLATSASAATLSVALVASPSVSGSLTAGTTITTTNGNITVGNTASTSTAGSLIIEKYHGSGTAITSGDGVANLLFQGYDGASLITASKIISVSSGTVATNRVAGDLEFFTHPDSTTGSTQRMVIAPTGAVTINAPDSGVGLTIAGGGLTSTGSTTLSSLSYGALVSNSSGAITSASPGTAGQVLTSNGASALPTFQAVGGTNTQYISAWTEITASQTIAVGNGYITNGGSLITLTLPTSSNVGDVFGVVGRNTGGWLIAQGAGQIIDFGTAASTGGAGGSISSTNAKDCVELICSVANATWIVRSAVGNITVT